MTEKKVPIDPYTGKPSVFLQTDSLVQLAEKGHRGARLLINGIGFCAMVVMCVSAIVCVVALYKIVSLMVTGE